MSGAVTPKHEVTARVWLISHLYNLASPYPPLAGSLTLHIERLRPIDLQSHHHAWKELRHHRPRYKLARYACWRRKQRAFDPRMLIQRGFSQATRTTRGPIPTVLLITTATSEAKVDLTNRPSSRLYLTPDVRSFAGTDRTTTRTRKSRADASSSQTNLTLELAESNGSNYYNSGSGYAQYNSPSGGQTQYYGSAAGGGGGGKSGGSGGKK